MMIKTGSVTDKTILKEEGVNIVKKQEVAAKRTVTQVSEPADIDSQTA